MEYFAGLDVSIEDTSICVVGDDGKVALETSVATDPVVITGVLQHYVGRLRRVGHEAGSLSPLKIVHCAESSATRPLRKECQ